MAEIRERDASRGGFESRDLLPGPETEMLCTVSEGSRHREERTEAGLCVTSDNSS